MQIHVMVPPPPPKAGEKDPIQDVFPSLNLKADAHCCGMGKRELALAAHLNLAHKGIVFDQAFGRELTINQLIDDPQAEVNLNALYQALLHFRHQGKGSVLIITDQLGLIMMHCLAQMFKSILPPFGINDFRLIMQGIKLVLDLPGTVVPELEGGDKIHSFGFNLDR